MSEPSNGAWPFQEIPEEEGLDISAIFGNSSAAPQGDPFAPPAAAQSVPSPPTPVAQEITPAVAATSQPTTAPIVNTPAKAPAEAPAENPIAAAFEQKTAENTKKGLLEKPPVFYHKGVKEEIDDPSMTFEELRIRKSDDFTDLEEGKRVSWSVEYCGIRKEVKDPKGTTIISMKEMIERSREFLDALKKTKDKDPCCYVKPKVEMKTKGNAAYKGKFGTLEEARNSDMGVPYQPNYVTQHFKLVLRKNHLRSIRFHDLRHTCASLLLKNGVPMKDIQEWLGHSSYNTTANIYAHLDTSSKNTSASKMSNVVIIEPGISTSV